MRNSYYACSFKRDGGKYYHAVIGLADSQNVAAYVRHHADLTVMERCETQKQARFLVDSWNDMARMNGTFAEF